MNVILLIMSDRGLRNPLEEGLKNAGQYALCYDNSDLVRKDLEKILQIAASIIIDADGEAEADNKALEFLADVQCCRAIPCAILTSSPLPKHNLRDCKEVDKNEAYFVMPLMRNYLN